VVPGVRAIRLLQWDRLTKDWKRGKGGENQWKRSKGLRVLLNVRGYPEPDGKDQQNPENKQEKK